MKNKKVTRLFFATDIHGSERTYRKFINAGKFYEANVIVMGGDISGKLMIPIIKEGNDRYRATLQGTVHQVETEEELKQLQERIGLLGLPRKSCKKPSRCAKNSLPAPRPCWCSSCSAIRT